MKPEIFFIISSFIIALSLLSVAFIIGEDVIVVIGLMFLGILILLEGIYSLFQILTLKNCPHCFESVKRKKTEYPVCNFKFHLLETNRQSIQKN